ncbi:hypothetical protein WMF11_30430 [Sorangium sp. So ce295]|uniref:hypothetical protein n=1 Tax=Sorangium sp. So ce295 TaxID=3133295 RepID=UPI003F5FB189
MKMPAPISRSSPGPMPASRSATSAFEGAAWPATSGACEFAGALVPLSGAAALAVEISFDCVGALWHPQSAANSIRGNRRLLSSALFMEKHLVSRAFWGRRDPYSSG